ncbi:MAG: tRNA (adenosine(37)-N6)-dimethylallyltransferase MiaA [Candidatus Krumholzibacteriota bacterium]|nr:tRNA (adenosine(37)-N6)-dimethylallyltransferase MiaA [Candidatus Krumholzibacteriota bacterium]
MADLPVLVVMGATAAGKSDLALRLAEAAGREIVSADSRQVYSGLRIGTAQPTAAERSRVAHHLVDFLPLGEHFSAQRFADAALALLRARPAAPPLVVGGTGFWLRSLWEGLFPLDADPAELAAAREELGALATPDLAARLAAVDSETARRLHPNDRQRILRALEVVQLTGVPLSEHHRRPRERPTGFAWRRVLVRRERADLRERIARRTQAMLAGGWIEEVRGLLGGGAGADSPGMRTLGYPEIVAHLRGELNRDALAARIVVRTRQFAKRQETWFARETRELELDPDAPGALDRLRALLDTPQGRC